MINNSKFLCPNCRKEDYQEIIFLNYDFQYKCSHCDCFHLFHYSGSNDIKNNINLYIGTINNKAEWIMQNTSSCHNNIDDKNQYKIFILFESLIKNRQQYQYSIKDINIIQRYRLSNKPYLGQLIFIANASPNSHFQECLRAIVRMKEHLLSENSKSFYNILIKNNITDLCVNQPSKLQGLDEIWEIDNTSDNLSISKNLTEYLHLYNSKAICVSKKTGPTKYGSQLIKNLLELKEYKHLYTTNQEILSHKYIAITVRRDSIGHRSGFDCQEELGNLCSIISSKGFIPIIIACTKSEINICNQIKNIKTLIATSLEDQIVFYSNYCYGLVGTNGSCCNIPSLFDVPMFILARERPFPDDFYCFGRLTSPYIEDHPYNGDLYKPNNIIEYRLKNDAKTSISTYYNEFNDWLYSLGKNILREQIR